MEELEGAAAVGGSDGDFRAVGKDDVASVECGFACEVGRGVAVDFDGVFCFEECADGGKFSVFRGGVWREVVEVAEGEGDFVEFCFSVRESAVDDACPEVVCEEAGVQDEDGDVGGDAELANFEDVVAAVGGGVEVVLSPVEAEALEVAVFVGNPVEVVESPVLV